MAGRVTDDPFLAMVFSSTTDTIGTERKLCRRFKTIIIPTPREISKSCGFAIRISCADRDELMEAVKEIDVPYAIYHMTGKSGAGRSAELIADKL